MPTDSSAGKFFLLLFMGNFVSLMLNIKLAANFYIFW